MRTGAPRPAAIRNRLAGLRGLRNDPVRETAQKPEPTEGPADSAVQSRVSEHLASLRDGRAVYIGDERVDDVTAHPAFRPRVQTIAARLISKPTRRSAS